MAPSRDSELKFKPLSQGLGFHPFSEGLPYTEPTHQSEKRLPTKPLPTRPASLSRAAGDAARASKQVSPGGNKNTIGAGAQAAGVPIFFHPPKPPLPQTGLRPQTVVPSAPKNLNELFGISKSTETQRVLLDNARLKATLDRTGVTPEFSPTARVYGYPYLFNRALAYMLDTVINVSGCAIALGLVFWKQKLNFTFLLEPSVYGWSIAFLLFFSWALTTTQEVLFHTTVAKKLFGLAVFGTPSTILIRSLFFLMSLALGGIGVLWALVHPMRRGWHDMVADLQPEEVAIL